MDFGNCSSSDYSSLVTILGGNLEDVSSICHKYNISDIGLVGAALAFELQEVTSESASDHLTMEFICAVYWVYGNIRFNSNLIMVCEH